MNKKQLGFLSVATVITLSGTYELFPKNMVRFVAADTAPTALKQTISNKALSYPDKFSSNDRDKFFLFPELFIDNFRSPVIDSLGSKNPTKSIYLSAYKTGGDDYLWNHLNVEIKINEKGKKPSVIYSGPLRSMQNIEILRPENYTFGKGLVEIVRAEIWMDQKISKTPNLNVNWNFVITPR